MNVLLFFTLVFRVKFFCINLCIYWYIFFLSVLNLTRTVCVSAAKNVLKKTIFFYIFWIFPKVILKKNLLQIGTAGGDISLSCQVYITWHKFWFLPPVLFHLNFGAPIQIINYPGLLNISHQLPGQGQRPAALLRRRMNNAKNCFNSISLRSFLLPSFLQLRKRKEPI